MVKKVGTSAIYYAVVVVVAVVVIVCLCIWLDINVGIRLGLVKIRQVRDREDAGGRHVWKVRGPLDSDIMLLPRGCFVTDLAGAAGICRVKYAVNTETDERVAIKVLDKEKIQKQNMGAQIKKEISIMKMVRHKHVVVLKEVLASRTKVCLWLHFNTDRSFRDRILEAGI